MRILVNFMMTLTVTTLIAPAAAADEMFDNFERETWAPWTATGDAFGTGPSWGSPQKIACVGNRYVTSYRGSDGLTGTLTSPEFTVKKPYVNFRIGGGRYPGKTELQLLVDGKVVRSCTGWNTASDGYGVGERLFLTNMEVRAFIGRPARLRIVDLANAGWGHVNVDAISFGDKPVRVLPPRVRSFVAEKNYVLFPMWDCGPSKLFHEMKLFVDGKCLRVMSMRLATGEPDWWAWMDVSAWRGKTLRFEVADVPDGETDQLDRLELADAPRFAPNLYDERQRPQLRFSAAQGWMNDPNGLVWQDGVWKLFYQHNPYSVWWGNLHWGYAESKDLIHWTDHGAALFPDAPHTDIISGSGIVDVENTAGFGRNAHVILVQHAGLCVWTAPDGKHYEYYKGNPVSRQVRGADPKVIWYAKGKKWICLTHGRVNDCFAVYIASSPNLRDWQPESIFYGDSVTKGARSYMHECPGLEELRIRGETGTAWILWGANAVAAIGQFDGHVFTPERERVATYRAPVGGPKQEWPWYAAQAFQNAPDGRVVLVPWLQTDMIRFDRRSSFNQAMGIPQELELVRTAEGLCLSRRPVKEMEALRTGPAVPFDSFHGELAEVHVSCEPGPDAELAFDFRGVPMTWSSKTQMLAVEAHGKCPRSAVSWPVVNGRLAFDLFLDRLSFEVFSPDGLLSAAFCRAFPDAEKKTISVTTKGTVRALSCTAHPLRSIWHAKTEAKENESCN